MIPILREHRTKWLNQAALICLLAVWPTVTFSSALMDIFLWASFFLCALSFLNSRSKPVLPDRTSLILIGLFFVAVLVSMTISDYPKQSFRGFLKILRQIVIFLLAFHLFQPAVNRNKLRIVASFSFLLLASDGIFQYFYGVDFLRGFIPQEANSGPRISASFEHYGKLAAYLCAILPVIIGWTIYCYKQAGLRVQFWLMSALSLAGVVLLVLTRSRGAFLALSMALIVTLILRKSWKILVVFIAAGAIFIAVLPRSMIIHFNNENQEQSLVERVELWHRAWDVIAARPLTGTGINTYAVAHQQFDTRKSWRVQNYYAHNGYLQIGAEIGLPGLLCFIIFLIHWACIQRPRSFELSPETEVRWGLFGGMIAFMIMSLADTSMQSLQPVVAFWFVIGLLGAFNSKRNVVA